MILKPLFLFVMFLTLPPEALVSQRKSNLAAFRYTSSSFKGLETVVLYLNAFPLKTFKKEAFIK